VVKEMKRQRQWDAKKRERGDRDAAEEESGKQQGAEKRKGLSLLSTVFISCQRKRRFEGGLRHMLSDFQCQ